MNDHRLRQKKRIWHGIFQVDTRTIAYTQERVSFLPHVEGPGLQENIVTVCHDWSRQEHGKTVQSNDSAKNLIKSDVNVLVRLRVRGTMTEVITVMRLGANNRIQQT